MSNENPWNAHGVDCLSGFWCGFRVKLNLIIMYRPQVHLPCRKGGGAAHSCHANFPTIIQALSLPLYLSQHSRQLEQGLWDLEEVYSDQ